ncbi:hypothetical protein F5141DRAFT_1212477 [Pisolithus sp. B1]|nr:hypothetical protein F5141DRAFT_1212477 [Pisolithus sp. B1]
MTGSTSDIDKELMEWDTVDPNEPINWDTVDTNGDDDIHDDDNDSSVTTDQRAHLQEQFDIICAVWAAVIKAVSLMTKRTAPIAYHMSILSGGGWIPKLLNSHPKRIQIELRVHKHVFKVQY